MKFWLKSWFCRPEVSPCKPWWTIFVQFLRHTLFIFLMINALFFHSIIHSIVQQKYSFKEFIHSKKIQNYPFKEFIHSKKIQNYSFKESIHSKKSKIIPSKKIFIQVKNVLSPRAIRQWAKQVLGKSDNVAKVNPVNRKVVTSLANSNASEPLVVVQKCQRLILADGPPWHRSRGVCSHGFYQVGHLDTEWN